MSVETTVENQRGVFCRHCGKPVKLPALVAKKEYASHQHHNSNEVEYQLISRVFVLRCHSCRKESVYAMNQIVDISFVPKNAGAKMTKVATN
jgi:hypothetical protein